MSIVAVESMAYTVGSTHVVVCIRKAFEKIAKSEAELRTIIDAIPQLITAIVLPSGPN
ncbi:MAG TPA: hypothetical protein VMO76_05155 [Candidatus Udaeobacter sp.]|nr:hypothetical protein [Candidatus Udaeobacter sp.]